MTRRPVLYCGDPHSRFGHIIAAAAQTNASCVVLLGDMEPSRPLEAEMAQLTKRGVPWYFIAGNHDADSPELVDRVWNENTIEQNIHARVVELPDGTRLAGLAGVFREVVWHPDLASPRGGVPAFRTREEHATATPGQDRHRGRQHFRHWCCIYADELDRLATGNADVLVTHEAPGYHPNGFDLLDDLARSMGVKVVVHGHQHDALDSSARWESQGFKTFGVGRRGVTGIDAAGHATVVVPGELDAERALHREVRQ